MKGSQQSCTNKLKEIEDRLLNINQQISLYWIGLKKVPNSNDISTVNKVIGESIKDIRKIREESK